jgi:hypothetical protein
MLGFGELLWTTHQAFDFNGKRETTKSVERLLDSQESYSSLWIK